MGSAICTFTLHDVQSAFGGKFKEQASSLSAWLPDTVLNFIGSHPLMDAAIMHEHEKSVFFKRDVFFTRLVVDKIKVDIGGAVLDYTVYYAGTNNGRVHKVVEWSKDEGSASILLDVFDVTPGEPIQRAESSVGILRPSCQTSGSSDVEQEIRQLSEMHPRPLLWMGHGCERMQTVFAKSATRRVEQYHRCVRQQHHQKEDGGDVGSKSPSGLFSQDADGIVVANRHYSKEKGRYKIQYRPDKYVETSEHGLVMIAVTEADSGRYDCWMGASLLCSYNVTVDAHRCSPPMKSNDYQKIYSDWCHEFEKYKSAMKTWEKKQAQCASRQNNNNQNSHPNEIYRPLV